MVVQMVRNSRSDFHAYSRKIRSYDARHAYIHMQDTRIHIQDTHIHMRETFDYIQDQ